MQPCLVIEVLPLKTQILLDLIEDQGFNRSPRAIRRLPNYFPSLSVSSNGVPIWSVWK